MPCRVQQSCYKQTPFTRQTNTATPSRVTENYDMVQDKTLSMGVSCGAAAISIYCTTAVDNQTDGQLCVKVRGHASRSSPSWLPSPALSCSSVLASSTHSSRYRLQQRDANVLCSVIAILRTPRVVASSARSVWHSANRLSFTLQRNSTSCWISFVTVTLRFDTAQVPKS